MDGKHIVVCDDEVDLGITIREYLEKRGYRISLATGGAELDAHLAGGDVDAVILDIAMPGEDGLSILQRLRARHRVGVIMLTASGDLVDRVVGLELGADDYLPKPASFRELDARLRAVLRRMEGGAAVPGQPADALCFAGFTLDRERACLLAPDGSEVDLTPLEFRLMRAFAENPDKILDRDALLALSHDRGWSPLERSVDIRVSKLRRVIEPNPSKPVFIRTVRGQGYLFDPKGGGA